MSYTIEDNSQTLELNGVSPAELVKCLFTMRETRVRSLGQEDPLEKEMAIHSSTIAWKIPWTEELARLQSTGLQRVGATERLHFTSLHFTSLRHKGFTHTHSARILSPGKLSGAE